LGEIEIELTKKKSRKLQVRRKAADFSCLSDGANFASVSKMFPFFFLVVLPGQPQFKRLKCICVG